MKELFFLLMLAAFAMAASAKVECQSLNNKGNSTIIVFTISEDERDTTDGLGVDNIIFECDGKTYTAKHVDADFGKTTTVTAKFEKIKKLANARLIFTVNGKEQSINIKENN